MSKQKAVVVGVGNYPNPAWNLAQVPNDVREMARLLQSPQGQFKGSGVTVLADAQADTASIRQHLTDNLVQADEDDTVFVYLAGHGIEVGGSYFFVSHDTNLASLARRRCRSPRSGACSSSPPVGESSSGWTSALVAV